MYIVVLVLVVCTNLPTYQHVCLKAPLRCDCSSTFSIIFPVQVAVWGYWKCSSSEFSVDRFPHIPTPFLGVETFKHAQHGLKHPRIPIITHFTPAPETGFLRPGWVYTDIAPRIRGETLKPPNGKKRWEQSMANHLAKHFWGVSS